MYDPAIGRTMNGMVMTREAAIHREAVLSRRAEARRELELIERAARAGRPSAIAGLLGWFSSLAFPQPRRPYGPLAAADLPSRIA